MWSKDSHCSELPLHLQEALTIICNTHLNLYASPDWGPSFSCLSVDQTVVFFKS